MSGEPTIAITKTVKGRLPSLPYLYMLYMKNAILGKEYRLSIAFVGEVRSRTLNKKYRGKDVPANVLSFPYSREAGEIVIAPGVAKRDARTFDTTEREFLIHLLIHGMLHLKGLRHGSKMKEKERKFRQKFARDALE